MIKNENVTLTYERVCGASIVVVATPIPTRRVWRVMCPPTITSYSFLVHPPKTINNPYILIEICESIQLILYHQPAAVQSMAQRVDVVLVRRHYQSIIIHINYV